MGALTLNRIIYIGGLGVLFVILGLYLGWSGFPYLIQRSINQNLALQNGSIGFKNWETMPVPIQFKIYLFNVTNPDEIQQGGRPKLQEVGPYIYSVIGVKENVTFNEKEDTVTYFDRDKYYYNEFAEGNKPESDLITTLNVGLMGTATMVEKLFPMGLGLVNQAIPFLFPNTTNVFLTGTAGDFIFKGNKIHCNYSTGPAMPLCNGMKSRAPPTIKQEPGSKDYSFALFRHKNMTRTGPFTVYMGAKNISQKGQLVEINDLKYIPNWEENTTCSEIKGTDSKIFSPVKNQQNDIYIYVSDVCLSLSASYVNQTMINNLIPAFRYESSKKNFDSVSGTPENKCRCTVDETTEEPVCLKRGVFEVSSCQGAPIVVSAPHFLNSDPEYVKFAEGIHPDPARHQTYVVIEPLTGVPISGRKRMQVNMFLRKINGINLLSNISEGLFPIAWAEEGANLHQDGFDELKKLFYMIETFKIIRWLMIAIGIVLMATSLLLYFKMKHKLCFYNNQIASEFEYNTNQVQHNRMEGSVQPQKLSVFNLPNVEMKDDNVQTFSGSLYGQMNKPESPTTITTTLPR